MTVEVAVAAVLFLGVIAYAVFGGADFGSGFWDLVAGGDRTGAPVRHQIDRSIGPVWEANHVWLIFVLVFLWTGYPSAFAPIMRTLTIPFWLAGLGIVLRGAAFAFRKFSDTLGRARLFGVIFALSSVITPFFLGSIAGAIASGRVPAEGTGDRLGSWLSPTGILGGVLAVLTCAYLAAVFLARDADRAGSAALAEWFRRRAIVTAVVTGVAALVGVGVLVTDAETLTDGLLGRAAPVLALSGIGGLGSVALLARRRYTDARVAATVAVGAVVLGWGVGQYDWMLVDELTIAEAAGARATLWALLVGFGLAGVTAVPSLIYLLWLTDRGVLRGDTIRS